MKKLLAVFTLALFVLAFMVPDADAQRRRGKKKHWATNAAIVGGGAVVGGLIGGGKGAAIGAGTGTLVAASRKGTRKRYPNSRARRYAKVGGGALIGGGIGGFAGRRGAAVGALAGAGVTYLYTRNGRKYYRNRAGRTFYYRNGQRHYL